MTDKPNKRGLGRGLSALMADVSAEESTVGNVRADMKLPIEKVTPNPDQPRRVFHQDQLDDLAASIREKGVIQPIIVRQSANDPNSYEIVAGERRWRAAQIARLHEIPVIIRQYNDLEVLEIAIIENIQRADLNPVEEATGYSQLMTKFGHTQEKLAEALGKSRSHIANTLRLLQLPEDIRTYLELGKLTAGHARALITAPNPSVLAREVIRRGLSVRQTESLVKTADKPTRRSGKRPLVMDKDADTRALENDLGAGLGMTVSIDHSPQQDGGRMTITYKSLDQLEELIRLLNRDYQDG